MAPVDAVELYPHGVFSWQGYEPAVKADLTSTALEVGGELILIDPVCLADSAWKTLITGRKPVAIFLTNGNHQRDSLAIQKSLAIPIIAPVGAKVEVDADIWIEAGNQTQIHGLTPLLLPGAGPGETAYFRPGDDGGVLVIGDAVINLLPEGMRHLPDKYCENPAIAKASVEGLCDLPVAALCFAHGKPVFEDAQSLLRGLSIVA